jgi:hypothetical protein
MKKNASRRVFIFGMIMMVIVVIATTRRESYNPWLPWNWFRKPEPPRPRPMPKSPGPEALIPEYRMGPPERPRPMPKRPYPMPERPRPMPKPSRPGCHPLSLDPRCRAIDPHEFLFSNRPAQPISPGVRARMEPR